jgi:hypothetical protein
MNTGLAPFATHRCTECSLMRVELEGQTCEECQANATEVIAAEVRPAKASTMTCPVCMHNQITPPVTRPASVVCACGASIGFDW